MLTGKQPQEVRMKKRGRPKGTGKPPGEKYILKTFRFPPQLWEAFAKTVPRSEWSQTIRGYMEKEIAKREKAER
jgi:hypothetical protein